MPGELTVHSGQHPDLPFSEHLLEGLTAVNADVLQPRSVYLKDLNHHEGRVCLPVPVGR